MPNQEFMRLVHSLLMPALDDAVSGFDVVIVDDRQTNRTIFSHLASALAGNVKAHAFGDAAESLRWLESHVADLVITDYKMPGMDGAEFIRQLRGGRLNADIPAIVITAYADRQFRLQALDAGATDFLHSPVDPQEFQTRVRNLLRLGQQQRLSRSRAVELAQELSESEATRLRIVRQSRKHLAQVIDTVSAMISAADQQGRLVFVNAFQARLAGRAVPDLLGSDTPLFGSDHHRFSLALNTRIFESGDPLPSYEEEIRDATGTTRCLLTTKAPLHDGAGAVASVLTTSIDITARRRAEERLKDLARHDGLTGLLNRSCFVEEMQRALAHARRGDHGFALHFVDLDNFKLINDGSGHQVGDMLLQEVSARLTRAVGPADMVARLGGDEFAILQGASPTVQDAADLATRIMDAMAQPIMLEDAPISCSASVGVAMHPRDGRTVPDLLRNADLAMYCVKIAGRRGFHFCGEDAAAREADGRQLESDLRSALNRNQLVLHYQPQFDCHTNKVVGAEALLRWARPGWGLLSPAAFLPVAERSGLIGPVSEWVLHQACRQAALWSREFDPPLRVSVNLSPTQVRRSDLSHAVLGAIDAAGLAPHLLAVEVIEHDLQRGGASLESNLRQLRKVGISVCVDNFGVDRVSLALLQRNSIDCIKLDPSVAHALDAREGMRDTVRNSVNFGHALSAQVVAMGVETRKQVDDLREEGCEVFQGFHFGKPCEAQAFTDAFADARTTAEHRAS